MQIILKNSLFILVTTGSSSISTVETIGLVFYQYSTLLSVPLALLADAFTSVVKAAYRMTRYSREKPEIKRQSGSEVAFLFKTYLPWKFVE
ncbi:MAG: hypothetical protein ACRD8W_01785 [Nitrososphaeraceae archaeon]